jgi:hypothetical protein
LRRTEEGGVCVEAEVHAGACDKHGPSRKVKMGSERVEGQDVEINTWWAKRTEGEKR